jgi:hypothetical protein
MVRLTERQKRMMWLVDRLLEEQFDRRPRQDKIDAWRAELAQLRAIDQSGWFLVCRYFRDGAHDLERG